MTELLDKFDGFVAASHELKTPLTLIAQLSSLLRDDLVDLTPTEQAQALERIQLSAQRTLRLVQGLTSSYRLMDAEQLQLSLEPLNLAQTCEDVAQELWPLAQAQSQTIELQWGSRQQQLVVGHRDLLRSVVSNLVDNAIRHNGNGASVRLHMRRQGVMMRLCVQDDGPGFSRQEFQAIHARLGKQAQPFRAHPTSSGLGLFIAGQLAAAMGGRIGMGSLVKGADFHLELRHSTQLSFLT
jgi:signal transduction histidine kinase